MNPVVIENHLSGRLTLGIHWYLDVKFKGSQNIDSYIKESLSRILDQHQRQLPPGYEWTRLLYRSFHLDPTRYRPSSEALWRRLKNKSDFPRIHPFVDLTNLLSLKYQICFGLYDISKISGTVEATLGGEGDTYTGIGKDPISFLGKNHPPRQPRPFWKSFIRFNQNPNRPPIQKHSPSPFFPSPGSTPETYKQKNQGNNVLFFLF